MRSAWEEVPSRGEGLGVVMEEVEEFYSGKTQPTEVKLTFENNSSPRFWVWFLNSLGKK